MAGNDHLRQIISKSDKKIQMNACEFEVLLCNLAVARAEPGIVCIFGSPLTEDGQIINSRKRGKSGNQKYRESRKHGISVFRCHSSVSTFVLSPWLGSQNQTTVPPINIAIIPWNILGHTVLVFNYVSHSRFQSWMQLCIQSCTGFKKTF